MPTTKKPAAKKPAKPAPARMSLAETMKTLEKAGSEQTRKTYRRHGAQEPMFGVSFATLKTLVKRIKVDQELAQALWETGNHDARVLAVKIADPQRMSPKGLDRWAADFRLRMCTGYIAALTAEGPHGVAKATQWLASDDAVVRATGWGLTGQMAMTDETAPDAWFGERLSQIEKTIHGESNEVRYAMNNAVISIGGRSPALRKAAAAAAKRIGKVDVDHGDTSCKTPDAGPYIDKMWAHAAAKKFPSPAAQERARESMRTRC